jgi:hypothetical protein
MGSSRRVAANRTPRDASSGDSACSAVFSAPPAALQLWEKAMFNPHGPAERDFRFCVIFATAAAAVPPPQVDTRTRAEVHARIAAFARNIADAMQMSSLARSHDPLEQIYFESGARSSSSVWW